MSISTQGVDAGQIETATSVTLFARWITWSVLIASTGYRALGLTRSLWWDEVYTAWAYVLRGPDTIRLATAYIPNNHTLFSWLTWATSGPFGLGEPVLRAWSFLPGTAASALLLVFAARRFGWTTAAVLSVSLALSPLHALLVTEARGYGLVLLSMTLLLLGATLRIEGSAVGGDLLLAGGTLIGALTIPTVAIPAAIFWLIALILGPRPGVRTFSLGAAVAAIGFWWYQPILPEITSRTTAVGSRHGAPPGLLDPLLGPVRLLGADAAVGLERLLPAPFVVLLLSFAVVVGLIVAYRSTRGIGLQLLLVPVGTIAVYGVLGMHLVPRYIGMLLPLTFLTMSIGLVSLASVLVERFGRGGRVGIAAVAAATVLSTLPQTLEANEPRQDFAGVAELTEQVGPDLVILGANDIGYRFYLRDLELRLLDDEPGLICNASEPAVFLEAATGPSPDLSDLTCLRDLGFQQVRFAQQSEPGFLTAWILDPRYDWQHAGSLPDDVDMGSEGS